MTFGFSTTIDLLSWLIAGLLAIKLIATLILLPRDQATRTATSAGLALWWVAKMTPLIAVPCLIAIALIQHDKRGAFVYATLMLFATAAVSVKVWMRFHEIEPE